MYDLFDIMPLNGTGKT